MLLSNSHTFSFTEPRERRLPGTSCTSSTNNAFPSQTTTTIHGDHLPPATIVRPPTATTAHTNDTSHDKNDAATPRHRPQQPDEHQLNVTVVTCAVHNSNCNEQQYGWELREERVPPKGQQTPLSPFH
jgi:hypothetical protein